jgi:hypothetical protein
MNKPIREPQYACENGSCAEEHTYTAEMLKVYEDKLWCDTCWGYDNPILIKGGTAIEWGDLDGFVPDHIVDANKKVWISVSDPSLERIEGNTVWGCSEKAGYQFESEYQDGIWCNLGGEEMSHWMPLPELPKVGE